MALCSLRERVRTIIATDVSLKTKTNAADSSSSSSPTGDNVNNSSNGGDPSNSPLNSSALQEAILMLEMLLVTMTPMLNENGRFQFGCGSSGCGSSGGESMEELREVLCVIVDVIIKCLILCPLPKVSSPRLPLGVKSASRGGNGCMSNSSPNMVPIHSIRWGLDGTEGECMQQAGTNTTTAPISDNSVAAAPWLGRAWSFALQNQSMYHLLVFFILNFPHEFFYLLDQISFAASRVLICGGDAEFASLFGINARIAATLSEEQLYCQMSDKIFLSVCSSLIWASVSLLADYRKGGEMSLYLAVVLLKQFYVSDGLILPSAYSGSGNRPNLSGARLLESAPPPPCVLQDLFLATVQLLLKRDTYYVYPQKVSLLAEAFRSFHNRRSGGPPLTRSLKHEMFLTKVLSIPPAVGNSPSNSNTGSFKRLAAIGETTTDQVRRYTLQQLKEVCILLVNKYQHSCHWIRQTMEQMPSVLREELETFSS
eukprot:Filipodium_phascolosomae@DN4848_c0_g1_i1.p1